MRWIATWPSTWLVVALGLAAAVAAMRGKRRPVRADEPSPELLEIPIAARDLLPRFRLDSIPRHPFVLSDQALAHLAAPR